MTQCMLLLPTVAKLAFTLRCSSHYSFLNGNVGEHESHIFLLDESISVEVVPIGVVRKWKNGSLAVLTCRMPT